MCLSIPGKLIEITETLDETFRLGRVSFDGVVKLPSANQLRVRPFRTRHGEDALIAEANIELTVEAGSNKKKFTVAQGSILFVHDGDAVKSGQILSEMQAMSRTRTITEKATKDVAADLAGEVKFSDLVPEEKKDRQGNTTRIAQRGGLLWVLSGEVYNLLPGAEPVVRNGDRVDAGSILAETKLVTENANVLLLLSLRLIEGLNNAYGADQN